MAAILKLSQVDDEAAMADIIYQAAAASFGAASRSSSSGQRASPNLSAPMPLMLANSPAAPADGPAPSQACALFTALGGSADVREALQEFLSPDLKTSAKQFAAAIQRYEDYLNGIGKLVDAKGHLKQLTFDGVQKYASALGNVKGAWEGLLAARLAVGPLPSDWWKTLAEVDGKFIVKFLTKSGSIPHATEDIVAAIGAVLCRETPAGSGANLSDCAALEGKVLLSLLSDKSVADEVNITEVLQKALPWFTSPDFQMDIQALRFGVGQTIDNMGPEDALSNMNQSKTLVARLLLKGSLGKCILDKLRDEVATSASQQILKDALISSREHLAQYEALSGAAPTPTSVKSLTSALNLIRKTQRMPSGALAGEVQELQESVRGAVQQFQVWAKCRIHNAWIRFLSPGDANGGPAIK